MPFTPAPVNDTYSTHRIPAVYDINLHAGGVVPGRGSYLENLIPMKVSTPGKDEEVADSRLGTTMYSITTGSTPIPLGVYVWEKTLGTSYYFHVEVVSGNLKVWTSTDGRTWTNVNTYAWSDLVNTRRVGFTEFINDTNTKSLVMCDGINGYVFTSNAAGTKITSGNFPTPHVASPVFLDGYVFLAKRGTGDIYNSDLNNPANWTAGNFLSAELYPDDVKALVKINNYILAIGQQSSEYFQDVGNSPGSPLARVEGSVLPFGTNSPESIAFTKNSCVLLANSSDGGMTLKLIEDFKYKDITPTWLIQSYNYYNGAVFGNMQRQYGQLIYSLSFVNTTTYQVVACPALQLDIQKWFVLSNTESSWWVMHSCTGPSSNPTTYFSGYSTSSGASVTGSFSSSDYYDTIYTNGTSTATSQFYPKMGIHTPVLEFGTVNRKAMNRLSLGYELPAGQSVATQSTYNRNVKIYWADYDSTLPTQLDPTWQWQTSIALNSLPTSNDVAQGWGGDDPYATQLGMFRKRAFSIIYGQDTLPPYLPIRFKYMEFDINKGQQ